MVQLGEVEEGMISRAIPTPTPASWYVSHS